MNLYTRSQIASRVARIVRVAGKVDAELHVVLCSILDHTREHGDYTAILPLLNGLPNGVRKPCKSSPGWPTAAGWWSAARNAGRVVRR